MHQKISALQNETPKLVAMIIDTEGVPAGVAFAPGTNARFGKAYAFGAILAKFEIASWTLVSEEWFGPTRTRIHPLVERLYRLSYSWHDLHQQSEASSLGSVETEPCHNHQTIL